MKGEINTEISRAIGRLEGKLEEGFSSINKRLDRMNGTLKTHDDKINELESFKDNLQGRMSVIGVISGIIGSFITMVVNYFMRKT